MPADDNRKIVESRELKARVMIEVLDRGDDFAVCHSHYKAQKHRTRRVLRETRVIYVSEWRPAAVAYMDGYVDGHQNARST